MRCVVISILALTLLSLLPKAARADTHETIHQAFAAMEAVTQDVAARAQEAILLGGALVSQHRNTVSGGALGCALGATAGASSTLALALPTGGVSIGAAPNAVAIGCGLGMVGGAALGYQLDHPTGP
jgi:hypothetical protein